MVIPAFDYMDVVGRATQEAKAESRYPVKLDIFVFLRFDSAFERRDTSFLLVQKMKCPRKKDTPDIKTPNKNLGLPSSVSSAHGVAPT